MRGVSEITCYIENTKNYHEFPGYFSFFIFISEFVLLSGLLMYIYIVGKQ